MKQARRIGFTYDSCWKYSRNSYHFPKGTTPLLVLEPGTMLASYRLLMTVGQGGMGAVYLAEDASGQKRAIKEMVVDIREPTERAKAVDQFAREAAMLKTLNHPLLVDVYETFEVDDAHYMVMDYVEGSTLTESLEKSVELPALEDVLSWADQICDVLDYLHNCDPPVIFRDLKPSNVMLKSDGEIRLIDFGIARVFEDESKTSTFIKGVGSRGYAPIEQYGAGGTDVRTDIYSLGATLYYILTGVKPPASVGILAGTDELEPLRLHNPDISRSLEQTVLRMMSLQKDNRYSSVTKVRQLLRGIADGTADDDFTDDLTGSLLDGWDEENGEPSLTQEHTEPTSPKPRLRLILLNVLLLVSLSAAFFVPEEPQGQPKPRASVLKQKKDAARHYRERAQRFRQKSADWKLLLGPGEWRYLDDGSDQEVAWRSPDFEDSSWMEGPEPFGYGDGDQATLISFGADPVNKHNTSYFRRKFEVQDLASLQTEIVRLRMIRDDGAVAYLNGKECFRSNMPLGEIEFETIPLLLVGKIAEKEYFEGAIDVALFRPGENTLAVEIHQGQPASTDLRFSMLLERHTRVERVSFGSSWKLSPNSDESDSWSAPSYDDSAWETVQLGQVSKETLVSKKLRKSFELESLADLNGLRCLLRSPGEVKIFLNGTEAFSSQPTSPFTGAHQPGWLDRSLLVEGRNVLAVDFLGLDDENTNDEIFDLQLITTP